MTENTKPALSIEFNKDYKSNIANDSVLEVNFARVSQYYDFEASVLTTTSARGGVCVTPFSKLDGDVLLSFREELERRKKLPPAIFSGDFGGAYPLEKESSSVLSSNYALLTHYFDFSARILTTVNFATDDASAVPFSELDRSILEKFHASLVSLGGTPPALPPGGGTAREASGPQRGFSL